MSINTFKKMIMVISLAVIAVSANAQDREEKDSLVSTRMRVNASELRTLDDAKGDSDDSGLVSVLYDQLVIQPCQGLLSTAMGFCKFAQQHPVAAFTLTTAYALPVVVALLPEQAPQLWYPSFICAKGSDTQQITYDVNGASVTNSFVTSDGGYTFPPYYQTSGYATASACSYASWSRWLYVGDIASGPQCYSDANCTYRSGARGSCIAQPYYTTSFNDQQAPATYLTALCVQAPSAP